MSRSCGCSCRCACQPDARGVHGAGPGHPQPDARERQRPGAGLGAALCRGLQLADQRARHGPATRRVRAQLRGHARQPVHELFRCQALAGHRHAPDDATGGPLRAGRDGHDRARHRLRPQARRVRCRARRRLPGVQRRTPLRNVRERLFPPAGPVPGVAGLRGGARAERRIAARCAAPSSTRPAWSRVPDAARRRVAARRAGRPSDIRGRPARQAGRRRAR